MTKIRRNIRGYRPRRTHQGSERPTHYLTMSFHDGTLDKDVLCDALRTTHKPILYTHGLSYRNPHTYKVKRSKQEAITIVLCHRLLDAHEYDDHILINTFHVDET